MMTLEERVIAVAARVLRLDPSEIRPEHSFAGDLGAESVGKLRAGLEVRRCNGGRGTGVRCR